MLYQKKQFHLGLELVHHLLKQCHAHQGVVIVLDDKGQVINQQNRNKEYQRTKNVDKIENVNEQRVSTKNINKEQRISTRNKEYQQRTKSINKEYEQGTKNINKE